MKVSKKMIIGGILFSLIYLWSPICRAQEITVPEPEWENEIVYYNPTKKHQNHLKDKYHL